MTTELLVRRALPEDASQIARLYSEPEVQANLLQLPYPSAEGLRAWLVERQARGRTDIHLVAELEGQVVGAAGLDAASTLLRRRHVMGLGMAVSLRARRQGVGRALMQALTDFADQWGQVWRIELTVYTDNDAAIALYRRFGFRIEGTHRAYALRAGRYVDAHAMARLHPNPPTVAWPEDEPDAAPRSRHGGGTEAGS